MQEVLSHVPVLLNEVLQCLDPQEGETYVDGTFGGGGYSGAILEAAACNLIAIDQDPDAITRGGSFKEKYAGRFDLIQGRFGDLASILKTVKVETVNGIVLDLGVSSFQLDEAERGFSFREEGPLDMRMGKSGPTAADILNTYDEKKIADILYNYGEEKKSFQIARHIVRERAKEPFKTTSQFVNVIQRVIPHKKGQIHPATRSFQALRIYINGELEDLEKVLAASINVLAPGGRLVVVSFHSLEDRIVKTFLKQKSATSSSDNRYSPRLMQQTLCPYFKLPFKKPLLPSAAETTQNPRARSARLRLGLRTAHCEEIKKEGVC